MAEKESLGTSIPVRLHNDYPTKAVILAAGKGYRLSPLTASIPKPLLTLDGTPLLGWIFRALNSARVADLCLVVNHLADQIIAFVESWSEARFNTTFCYQERTLGTADALASATDFIDQPFFLVAADYAMDECQLLGLKQSYQEHPANIVVSLREVSIEEAVSRSLVRFDEVGAIKKIVEKTQPQPGDLLVGASLIYILPPEIKEFMTELPLSPRGEYEIQDAVNGMLDNGWEAHGVLQRPPREWLTANIRL